jgi:hypothetical protein
VEESRHKSLEYKSMTNTDPTPPSTTLSSAHTSSFAMSLPSFPSSSSLTASTNDSNGPIAYFGVIRPKPVEQIDIDTGEVLRRYVNQKEASNSMSIAYKSISKCCQNKEDSSHGFRWRYYEGPPIDCNKLDIYYLLLVKSR